MLKRLLAASILLIGMNVASHAAPLSSPCTQDTPTSSRCDPVNSGNPLPVSASVSASISGFAPGAAYATVTATASSADVALPTGAVVAAFNTGTTAVSCILAVGAGTATASKNIIQAGSWFAFTVGSNTHIACINQAGDSASNVVVLSGGTGLPTGAGGGGGGSSSITTWASGTLGAMANYGTSPGAVLVPGVNAFVTNANSNGQATMANSAPVVLPSNMPDPCSLAAKTNVAISMTGTTTIKLVSLQASQKIYICSLSLVASAATVFSIADGTKVTNECDTAAEAVIGATTATHGLSLAANGGMTFGSGIATAALTNTAAHDLCLFQSGSGDISGNLTYVQRVP
jgi:hypothetical protein